jgi:hypothetical protein
LTPLSNVNMLLMQIEESEDDQAVFTDLFLSFPDRIVLDYDQQIFGNARWTKKLDEGGCPFKKGMFSDGLYHVETLFTPLVLHTPGKYWECFDVLQTSLGLHPSIFHKDKKMLQERNRSRALQYGPIRIPVTITIRLSPVDVNIPTGGDIAVLQTVCVAFFTARLNTVVVSCTAVVTVGRSGRRKLQTSGYDVVYTLVVLENPGIVTTDNVAALATTSLNDNRMDFVSQVVAQAVATQGSGSGLDGATNLEVMDVTVKKEPNCSGLGIIFCLLSNAFGGIANFVKWLVRVLKFAL